MGLIEQIIARAKSNKQRIVLPEAEEERTLTAADRVLADDIADLILIGNPEKVHALAELVDGTFIAQLSAPDMRMAIRYGMTYPQRMAGSSAKMRFDECFGLEFMPIDMTRFPSIRLAKAAMEAGGTMPAVLNASNDVAVSRFMKMEIAFTDIWSIVERTMAAFDAQPQHSIQQLETIDKEARAFAIHA